MKSLRGMCVAAGLLSIFAAGTSVQAGAISYEGVLNLGATQEHLLPQRTSNWWSFEAEAGDQVVITVHRLENSFDAAFNLYYGYGSGLELIASADNEVDQLDGYAGSGKDARYILTAGTTGTYSLEIFNSLPNAGGKDKAFSYQISFASYVLPEVGGNPQPGAPAPTPGPTQPRAGFPEAQPVNEPGTIGMLGAGLLGFGLLRRTRRKG